MSAPADTSKIERDRAFHFRDTSGPLEAGTTIITINFFLTVGVSGGTVKYLPAFPGVRDHDQYKSYNQLSSKS